MPILRTLKTDFAEKTPVWLRRSAPGAVIKTATIAAILLTMVPALGIYIRLRPAATFRLAQRFHRLLLGVMGIRVRIKGAISPIAPTLFVANHTSYLDIPVMGAVIPAAFVAKSEVEDWPLFGLLARMQKTVFIERRATSLAAQCAAIRARLDRRQSLILFPEGTSSLGLETLPFKSSLFSIVSANNGPETTPILVQPVSVACSTVSGMPMLRAERALYGWVGDMTLMDHLWQMLSTGDIIVDVVFHPPVLAADFPDRKALTAYCYNAVAEGVEASIHHRRMKEFAHPHHAQNPILAGLLDRR